MLAAELLEEVKLESDPVVKELAVTEIAVVVVPVKVWTNVPAPEANAKFFPAAMVVSPLRLTAPVPVPQVLAPGCVKAAATVTVPLAVNPLVAVINPEIVGVAVQAVGPTVNPEPLIAVVAPTLPKVKAV